MSQLRANMDILGGYWQDMLASMTSATNAWVARAKAVGVNANVNVAAGPQKAGSDAVKAAITALQTAGQNALTAATTANAYGLATEAQNATTAGQAALTLAQQGTALPTGSDATAWMSSAQTATTAANTATAAITTAMQSGATGTAGGAMPFDPGTAGGGGGMPTGGGGDSGGSYGDPFADEGDSGGGSDALARFRQYGEDPFEEDGGGGGYAAYSDPFEDAGGAGGDGGGDPFADDAGTYEQADESSSFTDEEMKEFLESEDPSGGGQDETVLGAVTIEPTPMSSYLAGLDILGGMTMRTPPRAATPTRTVSVAPPKAVSNPVRSGAHVVPISTPAPSPISAPKPVPSTVASVSVTPPPTQTDAPATTTSTTTTATSPTTASTAPAPSSFDPGAFDPGGGGGGGGGGHGGGDPFDQEAMEAEEGEEEMSDPDEMDSDELLSYRDQREFDEEALAEEEDVLGVSFQWQDIFNPAGIGIRAYAQSDTSGATQTGKNVGGTVHGTPSPAVAAQLAASKARLAQLQKAYAASASARVAAHAPSSPSSSSMPSSFSPMVSSMPLDDDTAAVDSAVVNNPDGTTSIVGFDDLNLGDDDEIIMQQWQKQITDEPADLERRRGSVHRGAAYLQDINFPPHGTSGGQEGGSMRPQEEIEVLGESYSRGLDILGAVPAVKPVTVRTPTGAKVTSLPRAGFVVRQTPAGNKHTSLVVKKPKQGNDKASVKNAAEAGKRAVSVAAKLKQKVGAAAGTKLKGYDDDEMCGEPEDVLGAASVVAKSPVAKKGAVKKPISKAVAVKMGQMTDQLAKKGKDTLAKAAKHDKLATTTAAKLKAGTKAVSAQMDPKKSTNIKGDEVYGDEVYGIDYDVVAAEMGVLHDAISEEVLGDILLGAVAMPDPMNPGYLTDGTPDPAYAGGYTGADPYASDTSLTDADAAAAGVPGPPDYGCGPAPKGAPPLQPGIDFVPDPGYETDSNVYSSTGEGGTVPLPEGAVLYDGTQKFPQKGVGSFGYFHQNVPGAAKPDGGNGSGYVWQSNHWRNWWASSHHSPGVDTRWHGLNPEEAASLPIMAKNSEKHGWGPLIGNPTAGWTKGMRYDQGADTWFWYYDQAPSWATAADKMKRDNQALLDYQALYTAAQTDYVTQQLQDRLDAQDATALAKQQAIEDAATARQQQQETTEAAHQADLQATADQSMASQQQLQDEASYRQQQIEWEAESRAQQSDTESMQSQMMTQARIDQQALETQARIEAQAAETQARIDAMYQGGDGGDTGYATDDSGDYGDGSGDDFDAPVDSMEDAKYALDNEDVMGAGGRVPGYMRGSDRMRSRKDERRG